MYVYKVFEGKGGGLDLFYYIFETQSSKNIYFPRSKWISGRSVVDFPKVLEGPCIHTYIYIYIYVHAHMYTQEHEKL